MFCVGSKIGFGFAACAWARRMLAARDLRRPPGLLGAPMPVLSARDLRDAMLSARDLRRAIIVAADLRKGSMLSARERRFFAMVLNTAFLLGLITSASSSRELRDDARDDWREREAMESRRGGGGMNSSSRAARQFAGGSMGVTKGTTGKPGERMLLSKPCSTTTSLAYEPFELMRMLGAPLRLGRGAATARGTGSIICSKDGRGLSARERRGASKGSSGTIGMLAILSFSTDGRGVCVGVLNAPDFARAAPKSASVASESMLPASLVRLPASSFPSLNESLGPVSMRVPIQVASLPVRASGRGTVASTNFVLFRLRLLRRR